MSTVPMVCPKCLQPVQAYQLTFSHGEKRLSIQKCPACGYEWSDPAQDERAFTRELTPPPPRKSD